MTDVTHVVVALSLAVLVNVSPPSEDPVPPVPEALRSVFGAGEDATHIFPGGLKDIDEEATGRYLSLSGSFDTDQKKVVLDWQVQHSTLSDARGEYEEQTTSFYPTAMAPEGGTHTSLFIAGYSSRGGITIEEWKIASVTVGSMVNPATNEESTVFTKALKKSVIYSGGSIGYISDMFWVKDRGKLWLIEYDKDRTVWELDPKTGHHERLVIPSVSPKAPLSVASVPELADASTITYAITDDGAIHYMFATNRPWDYEHSDVGSSTSREWFTMVDYNRDGIIDGADVLDPTERAAMAVDNFATWMD